MPVFMFVGGKNPGSQTITATGAGTFVVPYYADKLRVRMHGAGSGGVGHNGTTGVNGAAGGNTTFDTLTAGGGTAPVVATSTPGQGGTASGGDINTSGTAGGVGIGVNFGGAAANTAQGGGNFVNGPASAGPGANGNIYGGGGAGARTAFGGWPGGGGAAFCEKVYNAGDLSIGSSISYSVGAGGPGGDSSLHDGGNGAHGRIVIEWDYE